MNYRRKEAIVPITAIAPIGPSASPMLRVEAPTAERCHCQPLSSLQVIPLLEQEEGVYEREKLIPAAPALHTMLRLRQDDLFPRSTPLSLLLLHVSQLEHIHISPLTAVMHRRERYHTSPEVLEQILANVRRTIRRTDQLLVHAGTGAVLVFPDVDRQGIYSIAERVYHSLSLIQAETIIPPLKYETEIAMGIGTYPDGASSLEHLLYQVGTTSRRLTLRPVITAHLWEVKSTRGEDAPATRRDEDSQKYTAIPHASNWNVPFMQLPAQLPTRLKQLIPYHIANELRCIPVGRDHHCLTVAMADPTNRKIIHALQEVTGLTIFPVSCDLVALNMLLTTKW